ncbi:hypoxia up-regulated 1 [Trypanosoma conorhini]|uniref:Hypoxia up-regulated 1 n=1 Tax=Trypanosoma conorhini TaxID=83891 RepID=A0A422N0X0_9TRYP|nr:hypoxia up-regulated 1 [Trypanosoma conorhini]RNE99102.1 hypoxia up-regulated 1 [Trypanosoma conorhini]
MRLITLVVLTLLSSYGVSANVLGIDFGSDYIEVAGPHNGNNVDIVLNEQSHRKTDNYIGFKNGERYIGDQAKALAARFPLNMVTMINRMIGISYNSTEFSDFRNLNFEFETRPEERNTVGFSFPQDGSYTVEELYAMMLRYCQSISEKDGVVDPKSVVITIPFHSSLGRRQAILEAARLVGADVLGLMHSTTAAALYYGIRRRGLGNKTINLLVYDIGSTHTEVGIYKFSPPVAQPGKKIRNADSFGTLTTMAVVDDTMLGGRAFDLCIAKMLEVEAMNKMKIPKVIGGKSIPERKSQFSLLRAAKKAREILSANSKTPVTVEGIVPDRNFNTQISRKDLEVKCAYLFERVPKVVEEALSKSGLSLKEIDAFEMMGGTSRTPKIISDLSAMLGREVDRTLNSDEAAALGAAYYALRLSSFYRVRSFRVEEHIPFVFSFCVTPFLKTSSPSPRLLVENPALGMRRSITLNRTEDFAIELFESNTIVGKITVIGVKAALEQLGYFTPTILHPNNTHVVRVQLRLNDSGLFEVEEADAIYRYAANVSRKIKINATSNDTDNTNTSYQKVYSIIMKRKSLPISTAVSFTNPSPLSLEAFQHSREKISLILEKEQMKHEAAVAKNNLEAYVFWAKSEGILGNSTALGLLSAEEAEVLRAKLSEVQEWIEDGICSYEACSKDEFEKKLQEIKQLVAQKRQSSAEAEPLKEATGDDRGDL